MEACQQRANVVRVVVRPGPPGHLGVHLRGKHGLLVLQRLLHGRQHHPVSPWRSDCRRLCGLRLGEGLGAHRGSLVCVHGLHSRGVGVIRGRGGARPRCRRRRRLRRRHKPEQVVHATVGRRRRRGRGRGRGRGRRPVAKQVQPSRRRCCWRGCRGGRRRSHPKEIVDGRRRSRGGGRGRSRGVDKIAKEVATRRWGGGRRAHSWCRLAAAEERVQPGAVGSLWRRRGRRRRRRGRGGSRLGNKHTHARIGQFLRAVLCQRATQLRGARERGRKQHRTHPEIKQVAGLNLPGLLRLLGLAAGGLGLRLSPPPLLLVLPLPLHLPSPFRLLLLGLAPRSILFFSSAVLRLPLASGAVLPNTERPSLSLGARSLQNAAEGGCGSHTWGVPVLVGGGEWSGALPPPPPPASISSQPGGADCVREASVVRSGSPSSSRPSSTAITR